METFKKELVKELNKLTREELYRRVKQLGGVGYSKERKDILRAFVYKMEIYKLLSTEEEK